MENKSTKGDGTRQKKGVLQELKLDFYIHDLLCLDHDVNFIS